MLQILKKNYAIGETKEFADGVVHEKIADTGKVWEDWKPDEQTKNTPDPAPARDSQAGNTDRATDDRQTFTKTDNGTVKSGTTINCKAGKVTIKGISSDGHYAKAVGENGKSYKINLTKIIRNQKEPIEKSLKAPVKKHSPFSGLKGYDFAKASEY